MREPLQLPMPPIALAAAGLFVVALCDDGVHVFDHTRGSREVQHIDFAHDDAYVRLSGRLPAAADASGRCICLATSSQVLRLEPVAIEQQVRSLFQCCFLFEMCDIHITMLLMPAGGVFAWPQQPGAAAGASCNRAAGAEVSCCCCLFEICYLTM